MVTCQLNFMQALYHHHSRRTLKCSRGTDSFFTYKWYKKRMISGECFIVKFAFPFTSVRFERRH